MRIRFGLVAAGLVLLSAAGFALREAWPWTRLTPPEPPVPPIREWVTPDTVRPGESLGEVVARHGVGGAELPRLIELLGIDPRRIRAGFEMKFGHHDSIEGALAIIVRTRPDEETTVRREGAGWVGSRRAVRWEVAVDRVTGQIESSLSAALEDAVTSPPMPGDERVRLAWDLADVLAWQVDFTRDLQPNDRFAVIVERHTGEQGETRLGNILASELEVGGRKLTAYRFETQPGQAEYFDGNGVSLRRAFLRAPVEFRRVASGFARARHHPILRVWRRHEGVDYAAAAGTPVLAAGDGTVQTADWSGGYGRMIELRHRNGISTRYGHLLRFGKGIRPGARVSQGAVIGFVGSSGLATAAHLHYEFREHGAARDPSRVDLGDGEPVPSALLAGFRLERDRLRQLLFPAPPALRTIAAARE